MSSKSFDPTTVTRPHPSLMRYYLLCSLFAGPFFPFALLPLAAKYTTLRYRFDDRGVSMSWGLLFRREIYLTYRRIQDIHLTRNIVQRWMGLATVAVQTASGSSAPEMSVEGILEADALRDFLYSQMRGVREPAFARSADAAAEQSGEPDEALSLLREIRANLEAIASGANRHE